MRARPLRVDQALDLIPDADDMVPLRAAVLGRARPDEERAWAASEAYATVETRLVDAEALEAEIPALVAAVARHTEAVYRRTAEAIRAAQAGDWAAAAHAHAAAGEVEEDAGRLDAAERHYRKALELGRKPRDRRAEGLALRRLGRVARARGDLQRALRLYGEGYEIARAQQDTEGMVVACQGLGNVHSDRGGWKEAAEWYRRGLELLGGAEPSRALWQLQNNLSLAARKTGDLAGSREWLEAATRTVERLGDDDGRVFLRNAEGLLRVAEGRLAEAEAAYREGLRREASPLARATVLSNLSDCLLQQGRIGEAERAARELERMVLAYRVASLLPHVYRALGAVARERRDDNGLVFFEQALELSRAPGASPLELVITQHEYGQYEAAMGALEAAAARMEIAAEDARRIGAAAELEAIQADLAALRARSDRSTPQGERDE